MTATHRARDSRRDHRQLPQNHRPVAQARRRAAPPPHSRFDVGTWPLPPPGTRVTANGNAQATLRPSTETSTRTAAPILATNKHIEQHINITTSATEPDCRLTAEGSRSLAQRDRTHPVRAHYPRRARAGAGLRRTALRPTLWHSGRRPRRQHCTHTRDLFCWTSSETTV